MADLFQEVRNIGHFIAGFKRTVSEEWQENDVRAQLLGDRNALRHPTFAKRIVLEVILMQDFQAS